MLGIGALLGLGAASAGIGAAAGFGQQAWSQSYQRNEAAKGREFAMNQAQLDREFNAQQAQLARDWSERMSSTAYQRQIQDMKAAGLNPALLSGGAGGAATPGGVGANAGGSTPTPTAAGAYVPNAGMNFSSAMTSAIAATIYQNSREFSDNVRLEIASMKNIQKSQYSDAVGASVDSQKYKDAVRAALKKSIPWRKDL